MTQALPKVYLARHGETAWTLSGQHTGRKDLPLTSNGERNASQLGQGLEGLTFTAIFTSPLQRARRTCELAGFGAVAQVNPDLMEWDYGAYEGRRLEEILAERPPTGICFATDVLAERRRGRSVPGPIACWSAFETSRETSYCSLAGTSSGYWRTAG